MDIKQIAKKISECGGNLYLVGGAVRDQILNRKNNDEDYCVTGISSQEFLQLFPEAIVKGKFFEVFELEGKEFAMARTEKKNKSSENEHTNFTISTHKSITIEEDLARRDITINSIAKNVLTDEIIDPFNGIQDIKNKVIRATTKAFSEDPLRVYRAARIAAELEFSVEEDTIKLMKKLEQKLYTLSGERVINELRKALNAECPSIFFEILKQANVLNVHFYELQNLIGSLQPTDKHPEGDAFNHTMQVLDFTANEIRILNIQQNKYEILFGALVHDLGKGITPKEEYPHHYNHDVKGVKLVCNLGKRIKVPIKWIKAGETVCKEHMKGGIFHQMTPEKQVKFIERVSKTTIGLEGLQIIVNADKISRKKIVLEKNNIVNNAKQYINIINKEQNEIAIKKQKMDFYQIGKKCLQEINGKNILKKYKINPGIEFAERLYEERVKWMKNLQNKI